LIVTPLVVSPFQLYVSHFIDNRYHN